MQRITLEWLSTNFIKDYKCILRNCVFSIRYTSNIPKAMRPFLSFDTLGNGSAWRCSIKMWIGNAINLSVCRYLEQQMFVNKLCNMLSTLFSSSFSRAMLKPEAYQQVQLRRSIQWNCDRKGRVPLSFLTRWRPRRKYVTQMKSKNPKDKMHYSKMIMNVSAEGVDYVW